MTLPQPLDNKSYASATKIAIQHEIDNKKANKLGNSQTALPEATPSQPKLPHAEDQVNNDAGLITDNNSVPTVGKLPEQQIKS